MKKFLTWLLLATMVGGSATALTCCKEESNESSFHSSQSSMNDSQTDSSYDDSDSQTNSSVQDSVDNKEFLSVDEMEFLFGMEGYKEGLLFVNKGDNMEEVYCINKKRGSSIFIRS